MKRVNFHLTAIQIAELQSLSERTGLSVAEIVRRLIDDYLKREDRRKSGKEKK